ncbi:hypothetical protein PR003_g18054 [Phytophthora rubi]|uniref:Uncharacterized protein n=1 Tax=Phytophthora rubi TaxID=129364 RepID=A0A6A3KHX8_9STRA|nr:hypothetical protein PR001_g17152 [Phytophthora rubi]KAE9014595.1 hypothetical protein PR002_g14181 [Phytophthora rubi]KAE9319103.1 hypothetical protein PR003_g18054 [Phytophthora rubi]
MAWRGSTPSTSRDRQRRRHLLGRLGRPRQTQTHKQQTQRQTLAEAPDPPARAAEVISGLPSKDDSRCDVANLETLRHTAIIYTWVKGLPAGGSSRDKEMGEIKYSLRSLLKVVVITPVSTGSGSRLTEEEKHQLEEEAVEEAVDARGVIVVCFAVQWLRLSLSLNSITPCSCRTSGRHRTNSSEQ